MKIIVSISLFLFCTTICANAQSFAADESGPSFSTEVSKELYFVFDPASKLQFVHELPAKKLVIDLKGDKVLFPAMFPEVRFFNIVKNPPSFLLEYFKGRFTAYLVGGHYIAIHKDYDLYSATIKNDKLFILARDKDDDVVELQPHHFAVYSKNGTPKVATEIRNQRRNVSVLVDRSSSMEGFDADISAAIKELSQTFVKNDFCGLYEFGYNNLILHAPNRTTCQSVFSKYVMSGPNGFTPLFSALEQSYLDVQKLDVLSAVVVISDGAPSDAPSKQLPDLAKEIPTFVIWVGDHTTDYLAEYSTAHSISDSGVEAAVRDFLRVISFSIKGHQTFKLTNK